MSRFKSIDNKLSELADKLNAKLTKDRPSMPEDLRNFEERRIDWTDGQIRKAIIIQPTFKITGVDSSIWNFINIAWYDNPNTGKRLRWIQHLVDKSEFEVIEKNIDKFLENSEITLSKINMADLK